MFRTRQTFVLTSSFLILGCVATAFLITRGSNKSNAQDTQIGTQTSSGRRNLSLRPEAIRVNRKLGNRFASTRRDSTVLSGTLLTDKGQTSITVTRNQSDMGEAVELALTNQAGILTWNQADGAKSASKTLDDEQRLLIERLVFDSADYFVLAQLRGASYQTIAKNVRPDEAGDSDNYTGPVWDIVRVDDPERDTQKKPTSSWRLFYINSNTDLIEKIVSEVRGERIETVLSNWTTVAGERVPGRVTWKIGPKTLMEFSLSTFTVASR